MCIWKCVRVCVCVYVCVLRVYAPVYWYLYVCVCVGVYRMCGWLALCYPHADHIADHRKIWPQECLGASMHVYVAQ